MSNTRVKYQVRGARGRGIYRVNVGLLKPFRYEVRGALVDGQILSVAAQQGKWVSYPHRLADPLLQYLPTILARWIVENLFKDLNLPDPMPPAARAAGVYIDHSGRQWSTAALNSVLQTVLVEDEDGTQLAVFGAIEHESELCEGTPRIRCRTQYRGAPRKVSFFRPH